MEEKNVTKISLSTFLLMIFLIIIVVLTVIIILLLNNNHHNSEISQTAKNELSNDVSSQTADNSDNGLNSHSSITNETITANNNSNTISESKNGTSFIQFSNKFYSLEDIAIEWRNAEKIKNYKNFEYDLDGDGNIDKITIKPTNEESYGKVYLFELNGKKFAEHSSRPEIYIVDLNKNDNKKEIVIFDEGPSDDPNYTIYVKKGNDIVKLSNIGGYPLKCDEQGIILCDDFINGQTSPKIYFSYNYIENNKIEEKKIDIEKIKKYDISSSRLYFSKDYKNVDKLMEQVGCDPSKIKMFDIEELTSDKSFKIIDVNFENLNEDFDLRQEIIKVVLSDGREGYIFHIQWAG